MSNVELRAADVAPKNAVLRIILVDDDGPVLGSAKKKEWARIGSRWTALGGTSTSGSSVLLDAATNLCIVGVGKGTDADWYSSGVAVGRSLEGPTWLRTTSPLPEAFVEGVLLGGYRFSRKSQKSAKATHVLTVVGSALPEKAITISNATNLARNLANTTSNVKSPGWLARQAAAISGVKVKRFAKSELERFGGLQAVGAGSRHAPEFVTLSYRPSKQTGEHHVPHIVLVGKGITFDSGGLSLKPADAMTMMKTDMAGAAAVIGTMSALAQLDIPVRVTGVLAIAENMPGERAMRPGDVITHYGGRTSEVLNTDAEGRLVLADAIAFAAATLQPTVIIDLATLTGAATFAFGRGRGAVFSNSDRLAKQLVAAGERSRDALWQLPLEPDYAEAIASEVADAANSATNPKLGGGAITAALFLEPFAAGKPWAHLDIAGPARNEKERSATGFGVRLLLNWLATSA